MKYKILIYSLVLIICVVIVGSVILFVWPNSKVDPGDHVSTAPLQEMCSDPATTPGQLQKIIGGGVEIDQINRVNGRTPLMEAAICNPDPEVHALLIKSGADVNAVDGYGFTPLMHAAGSNPNAEVLSVLMAEGADINEVVVDENSYRAGWTALLFALADSQNSENGLLLLESGANFDTRIEDSYRPVGVSREIYQPLHFAIINGADSVLISQFIDSGADVNRCTSSCLSPLMLAFENVSDPDIAILLLDAGADVTASSRDGITALTAAIRNDVDTELVSRLIESGADVNAKRDNGLTPLMLAIEKYHDPDIVTQLLEAGADPVEVTESGLTPLMRAARSNPNPELIAGLVEMGFDLGAQDENGMTALMHAAQSNPDPEIVSTLAEAGADVNRPARGGSCFGGGGGLTALFYAAGFNSNPEVITALLEAGADMNHKARVGIQEACTPLMVAAIQNPSPEVFTALLEGGCDIDATNEEGNTALMLAVKEQINPELVKAIIRSDPDLNVVNTCCGDSALSRSMQCMFEGNTNSLVTLSLIEAGADVSENSSLIAPIFSAIQCCDDSVVLAVIKAGAELDVRNSHDQTPLMRAVSEERGSVVEMLLDAGADANLKEDGRTALSFVRGKTIGRDAGAYERLRRATEQKSIILTN